MESLKFAILTPLGFIVRTSENYWQKLLIKHPDLEDLLDLVKETLSNPEQIRRSKSDANVLLFYLTKRSERWVVAVAKRLNDEGFLITAYQTDAIKEGEIIWHK